MSKALFDYDTIQGIANTIRNKIPQIGKIRASDMSAIIGTLHGYQSRARALSSDPVSYPISTFSLSNLAFISRSNKNTTYNHAEPVSAFAFNDLTFASVAGAKE